MYRYVSGPDSAIGVQETMVLERGLRELYAGADGSGLGMDNSLMFRLVGEAYMHWTRFQKNLNFSNTQ